MADAGLRIGKYEVIRELGRGGFGDLYVARDTGLDREVALKVLRSEHVGTPQLVERFLQEARAAAKIDHPGIVTVFDCGDAPDLGSIYIAMELLRGEDLSRRLARGRLPLAMALGIARQAANALAAAHRAGIIHRDLKPDNLFLVPDAAVLGGERIKLLDFGIAKLSDPGWRPSVRTHSMTLLGTPLYMSPEQCKSSAKVDARSDIYSLGCIVFEMVCGATPYDGDSGELIAKHQLAPVPSARERAPDLPAGIDSLLRSMLAKVADDRPVSMEQVEAVLSAEELGDELFQTSPALPAAKTRRMTAEPWRSPSTEMTVPQPMLDEPVDRTVVVKAPRWRTLLSAHRRTAAFGGIGLAAFVTVVVAARCTGTRDLAARATPPMPTPAPAPTPRVVEPPPDAADAVAVVLTPIDADIPAAPPPVDAAVAVQPAHPSPPPHPQPTHDPTLIAADCAPSMLNTIRSSARQAFEMNNYATAEARFELLYRCGDVTALPEAFMAACDAEQVDHARQLFQKLPVGQRGALKQICLRQNIDPEKP